MKKETYYEAMENINDELLLEAIEEPKQKFHSVKKIRWTVLAAAIALLISVPVVAASFNLTVKRQENGFWDVYNKEARFSLDEFSPELLEKAEEIKNPYGAENYYFIGKTEAEDFLGIKLPENPALKTNFLLTLGGNTASGGNYIVGLGRGQNDELIRVWVATIYDYPGYGRTEYIDYDFITEKMPFENAGHGWEEDGKWSSSENPENYITENGRECVLVKQEHKGTEYIPAECGYLGIVMINKINIRVDVRCDSYEKARERVIEILENFE